MYPPRRTPPFLLFLSAPFAHLLVIIFFVHVAVLQVGRLGSDGIVVVVAPPYPIAASPHHLSNVGIPLPILLRVIFGSVRTPYDLLGLLGILLALHWLHQCRLVYGAHPPPSPRRLRKRPHRTHPERIVPYVTYPPSPPSSRSSTYAISPYWPSALPPSSPSYLCAYDS